MHNVNIYSATVEMTKWVRDLKTFNSDDKFENVRVVNHPNYADLRREIMVFKNEIEWDGMWDHYDAQDRLAQGWIFVGFFAGHQIKGWGWLNTDKKYLQNLYINKSYRNYYNAKKIVLTIMKASKELGFKEIYCDIDDWNENSQIVAIQTGWIKCE